MNKEEILDAIAELALSQGFYGRLYRALNDGSEAAEDYLEQMVAQNFGSVIDMILWIEC